MDKQEIINYLNKMVICVPGGDQPEDALPMIKNLMMFIRSDELGAPHAQSTERDINNPRNTLMAESFAKSNNNNSFCSSSYKLSSLQPVFLEKTAQNHNRLPRKPLSDFKLMINEVYSVSKENSDYCSAIDRVTPEFVKKFFFDLFKQYKFSNKPRIADEDILKYLKEAVRISEEVHQNIEYAGQVVTDTGCKLLRIMKNVLQFIEEQPSLILEISNTFNNQTETSNEKPKYSACDTIFNANNDKNTNNHHLPHLR